MRFVVALATAVAALNFGGCATTYPIYNAGDVPILGPAGRTLTMGEVQSAIQRAGTYLGWQINAASPGHLVGRLAIRSHLAVVDIEHGTKSYSIKYRDSTNLDAGDGMIHRNYNEWVRSLDRGIRNELLTL